MNSSGVPCSRPRSDSGSSTPRRVSLAPLAIPGTALTKAASWAIRTGTRKRSATITAPISSKNVERIASPRGMRRESHRTGNESAIATAKPPRRVTGTVGAAHMSSTSTTSPSTRRTVRVRREIRMGVGRALDPPSLVSPPGFSLCLSANPPARSHTMSRCVIDTHYMLGSQTPFVVGDPGRGCHHSCSTGVEPGKLTFLDRKETRDGRKGAGAAYQRRAAALR
jgi:hypothetical protein